MQSSTVKRRFALLSNAQTAVKLTSARRNRKSPKIWIKAISPKKIETSLFHVQPVFIFFFLALGCSSLGSAPNQIVICSRTTSLVELFFIVLQHPLRVIILAWLLLSVAPVVFWPDIASLSYLGICHISKPGSPESRLLSKNSIVLVWTSIALSVRTSMIEVPGPYPEAPKWMPHGADRCETAQCFKSAPGMRKGVLCVLRYSQDID